MNDRSNRALTPNAKKLRRNMTKEERRLWYDFLKMLPFVVHRQKVIGHYIVDFYCAEAGVVIELNGSQHYVEGGIQSDAVRDAWFKEQGFTVLRYSNAEVMSDFNGVCADILRCIDARTSKRKPKPSL